jgi:hypothetical protein
MHIFNYFFMQIYRPPPSETVLSELFFFGVSGFQNGRVRSRPEIQKATM